MEKAGANAMSRIRGASSKERVGRALLTAGVIICTFAYAWRMNRLFETGEARHLQDMASINQAIWNSGHGNILYATILRVGVRDHLEPILVFYGLNYRLGGNIKSLMFIHGLLISLGAVPFYLLARRRELPVWESLVLAFSYFVLPPLHNMMTSAWLRPELLFFPALTLMAYSLVFSRDRCLLASVVLAFFCKESAASTVMGMGLYLMFFERRRRAGAVFAAIGAAWVPVVSFGLLPSVAGMEIGHMSRIRPCSSYILQMLWGKLWPAVTAVLVVALLFFRRWAAVIGLPHMAGLLFFKTRLRYIIPIIPIPWFLTMDVLASWKRVWVRRSVLLVLPIAMLTVNVWDEYWERLEPAPDIKAAKPLMEMIPPEAAVCTNNRLLLHLSSRARIYEFNRRHRPKFNRRDYIDADYFLLRDGHVKRPPFRRHKTMSAARRELEEIGMELVAEAKPWKLYRRTGTAPPVEYDE